MKSYCTLYSSYCTNAVRLIYWVSTVYTAGEQYMPPKNYVNMSIRREVKEALTRLRNELGFGSESDVIVYLLRVYEEHKAIISVLNSINAKLDTLISMLAGRAGSTANAVPKAEAKTATKVPENLSSTQQDNLKNSKVLCKRRSEVKDLKSYVELLEKKGLLIDWWEEGEDKICFEINTHSLTSERNIYK